MKYATKNMTASRLKAVELRSHTLVTRTYRRLQIDNLQRLYNLDSRLYFTDFLSGEIEGMLRRL